MNALQHKQRFRSALLRWYHHHGRDLPWRDTRDPYAILVSEFMLQQTQVASVLPYYDRWLRRFPDFHALARASQSDVLHAWQGLGYYARARNLHAAAKTILTKYGGRCPRDVPSLQSLPGIGRYTANAIASFAFDQPVAAVDANIARLMARLFNIQIPSDSSAGRNMIWDLASRLVGHKHTHVLNSALMDLGAMICIPRAPKCGLCPVQKFCRARHPGLLPIRRARPRLKRLLETHSFAVRRNKILLEQSTGRWRGMWILPPLSRPQSRQPIHAAVFPFTHHRINLAVFRQKPAGRSKHGRWFSLRDIDSIPLPCPHRRAVLALIANTRSFH